MCHQRWINITIVFILACCLFSCVNHKNPDKTVSKFFVVRNAERYPGFEGHLTWYGRLRSGDLMRLLRDSGISRIYVTPFSRTLETADSLRLLKKIDTVRYLADTTGADLMRSLKDQKDFGRTILVVGHRATVPVILKKLGADYPSEAMPDSLNNIIFEVVNDHGKVNMKSFSYGRPNMRDTSVLMP